MSEDPIRKKSVFRSFGEYCMSDDMERLGIRNTMRLAKTYNRLRYRKTLKMRQRLFRQSFDELIEEHGGLKRDPGTITDGYLIDDSMDFPHLDALLEQADEVIAERGKKSTKKTNKPFIQDIHTPDDLKRFPAFLDFVTSPEILSVASRHLELVPMLSKTLPPGVRFVESWREYDEPGAPLRDSQLYHLDHHDAPLVYVIVLLRDTTIENGPWTFLPASVSDRAVKKLGYRKRGEPYRVTDERMYEAVSKEEAIEFSYPRGTVLFIDSNRCFHYGSRNAIEPRYQMMYGLVSPCRTDFSEEVMPHRKYKTNKDDSRLRRLALDKTYFP